MKVFSALLSTLGGYAPRLKQLLLKKFCVQTLIVFVGEKFSIEHNIINMFLFNYYISSRKNGFLEKGLSEASERKKVRPS